MGLVATILQGIYIFPADEISIRGVSLGLQAFVNGLAGALVGCLLFFMLLGFDTLVLGALGVRGFKSILYGSLAPFLAVPLVCIPIHTIFSDKLSSRGYGAIVVVLIVVFLAWHALVLGINLVGHLRARSSDLAAKRALIIAGVLLALELAVAFIVLTQVPLLFDVDFERFLEEFF
jgi:hypothetical protein